MGWKTLMLLVVVLAGIGSACAYDWEWQSGAEVRYTYINLTTTPISFTYPSSPVTDNGTIEVGDNLTRDYIINNASGLTPGGAHLSMRCYEQGGYTIVKATVSTDDYTVVNPGTAIINGYSFGGTLEVDGITRGFDIMTSGNSKTFYFIIGHGWSSSPPIQTPIPPLAIILVLMTIPAIVLRKITK